MSHKSQTTLIAANQIKVRQHASDTVAVVGNPNSGKSTLFNRLTGLRQKTGNYPGVTVEKHSGIARIDDAAIELIDLPGMYALSAHSLEERIAVDVVLGRLDGIERPAGIVAVVDATHLYQGLYLLQQLMELDLPILVALTMTDAAKAVGLDIDIAALERSLGGVRVCPVVATTGQGLDAFRDALVKLPQTELLQTPEFWPVLAAEAQKLAPDLPASISRAEIERALIDVSSEVEAHVLSELGDGGSERLAQVRARLFATDPPLAAEARHRYQWVRKVLGDVQRQAPVLAT
jgi:ferrous iron transport protein B